MPRTAKTKGPQPKRGPSITWRPTKIMNMRDLSKDDDFLSHLLVEKLGTGDVPLLVHKMDATRRLPKTDASVLLGIVQRLVAARLPVQHACKQAVDELLALPPIRYYLKTFSQKQINAFATHASRYLELYHPAGSIEIAHTSRYSHRTGKSELCILATRAMAPGTVITELKGSMANLTNEEDQELKRTDVRNKDIRRDFSVIHSKQMKKNHLFLGPARFVNHDCDNNCELFREGKYITFRVLRPIQIGEEITAHYGDGYFGVMNRHCLCETCEKHGRGGYAPNHEDGSDSGMDNDSESEPDKVGKNGEQNADVNLNERRTRRGVYAIMQEDDDDSDESEDEEEDLPLAHAPDVPADDDVELEAPMYLGSEAASLAPNGAFSASTSLPNVSSSITHLGLDTPPPSEDAEEEQEDKHSDVSAWPSSGTTSAATTQSSIARRNGSVQQKSAPLGDAALGLRRPRPDNQTSNTSRRVTRSTQTSSKDNDAASARPSRSSSRKRKPTDALPKLIQDNLQHFATPPLSEDTASLPDSATPSSVPITRRTSSRIGLKNGKVDAVRETSSSRPPTPARDKGKERTEEEPDARVLRARPSAAASHTDVVSRPVKPSAPKGPDGKLLPICSTCSNVLPVISVDSRVIWGLDASPRKGKKRKEKQECPRCMRHFAIYGLPWPTRIASNRPPFIPTPREDNTAVESSTRRVSQKALPTLVRKLEAAAAESSSRLRDDSVSEERPTKRRKMEPHPKVEMSDKSKELLADRGRTRSGRTSVPSPKVQETHKRKRGRPRLSSPRRQVFDAEKPMKLKSLAVQCQPRDSNGRFGKKPETNGLFMRKKMLRRFQARREARPFIKPSETVVTPRPEAHAESIQQNPNDKNDDENVHDPIDNPLSEPSPNADEAGVSPKLATEPALAMQEPSFKRTGLSLMPNPMNFARRKWAPQYSNLKSADNADEHLLFPSTSETLASPVSNHHSLLHSPSRPSFTEILRTHKRDRASSEEGRQDGAVSSTNTLAAHSVPVGRLSYKPSPATFARRRWTNVGLDNDVTGTPSQDNGRISDAESTSGSVTCDLGPHHSPSSSSDLPAADRTGVHQDQPIGNASTGSSDQGLEASALDSLHPPSLAPTRKLVEVPPPRPATSIRELPTADSAFERLSCSRPTQAWAWDTVAQLLEDSDWDSDDDDSSA